MASAQDKLDSFRAALPKVYSQFFDRPTSSPIFPGDPDF